MIQRMKSINRPELFGLRFPLYQKPNEGMTRRTLNIVYYIDYTV